MKKPILKFCIFASLLISGVIAFADSRSAWTAFENTNYQQAYQDCSELAQKGDSSCQALLGTLYKYGFGVPQDNKQSLNWLNKSADSGDPYGQEILGDTLLNGRNGVEKDLAKAYELFIKASAKGNLYADNQLGQMYRLGIYVKQNTQEGIRYLQTAADKGNRAAQVSLANIYRLGEGVTRNPDLAFRWAVKSSEQTWGPGLNILGVLYRDGVGVAKDSEKAITLFKQAIATNRSPAAFSNLGRMYYRGTGIPINIPEARIWFEAGAKANDGDSYGYMSDIFVNLPNDSPDKVKAFEYAKKSASLNSPLGFNLLGYVYLYGIGTPVDYPKALTSFQKALSLGNEYANYYLGLMYDKGFGVSSNPSIALDLYKRALSHANLIQTHKKLAEDYVLFKNGKPNANLASGSNSDRRNTEALPSQVSLISNQNQSLSSSIVEGEDKLRSELIERLEKLQNQLNSLQAASNGSLSDASQGPQKNVFANRKALVIGNDTYKSVPKLLNAREDARTIAANLTAVGYQVTLKLDLDEKDMKAALRTFAEQVEGGDEVLFFFAGHGVQLGSTNYLLPTDLAGNSEAQVRDEAIQLQRVLDEMSERKAKFTLAMIDACRDNPFKSSGRAIGGRGLAPTTAATGQMVIFSAGTGQQALDKLGNTDKNKNGLFTRVFVQEMQKPNLSVDRVIKNVRNKVAELAKTVGHEQVPAIYDQVLGDFYFKK